MDQMAFDFKSAVEYMTVMLKYDGQRDELNEAINDVRTEAREKGVPTKAVEAAIRAAKNRRKSQITNEEFAELMGEAERRLDEDEE